MENIVLSTSPEGLRCHIGLVIVQKIQKWHAALRVGRLGPKPGQPTRELAQPVPYTGGVPGDIGFNERAACGVLSFLLCWALCMAHLFAPIWKLAT